MKTYAWFEGKKPFPAQEDGSPLTLTFERPADCPWD